MKTRLIVSLGLLTALAGLNPAAATVTPQTWWRFGEGGTAATVDASGNARNFDETYFQCTPPLISQVAAGGVLGNSGVTSTNSYRFGLNGCITEFLTDVYTPPSTNYGVEIWYQPQNLGYVGGGPNQAWIISSGGSKFGLGAGGGVCLRVFDNFDGTSSVLAGIVLGGNSINVANFGPPVLLNTNEWIHLALVNDNGTLTFYTNGVACATNDNNAQALTDPAGYVFIGTDGGVKGIDGYLDEARIFTFAPGQFSPSDLLYAPSPRLISQPANAAVWNGGALSILANVSKDPANTFEWQRSTTNLPGQTSASLYLPTVTLAADNGSVFRCNITNNGIGLTTSNATLTVVPVQTDNVNAYRTAVNAEASLLAYFPVDGSSGATVANTEDGLHNGTLELNARYDGQTNRTFGERGIYLTDDGDVKIPSNAAYEFASGNGTIEALVYLGTSEGSGNATIFSLASDDGSTLRYAVGVSRDGNSLVYTNDSGVQLTWPVPANLLNRLTHVAFVMSGGASLTAYVDGSSLGAIALPSVSGTTGVPAWIGSATTNAPSVWSGIIDELAVYSSALPAATIAIHNSKFVFGTNTAAPIIVSQSASKTIYAGGSPVLAVSVSGTPPLSYQWRTNGIAIPGATNATLTLANVSTSATAAYTVLVTNPFGSTNNNSNPINLTVIVPPNGYAAAVMADNPSAFWRLNETSGTTMTDYAGQLNGAYTGTFTLGAAGSTSDSDSAVTFGGGYGEVSYSSILNRSGPFTIEFWARPSDNAAGTAVSSQLRSGAARLGLGIFKRFNVAGWEVHMGNAAGVQSFAQGATPVNADTWYHVAVVYDGVNTVNLYVFGYLDATDSNASSGVNYVPNPSAPFEIGVRNGGAFAFPGTLDDVAFYDYALSQSQIQSHVGVGLPLRVAINSATNIITDSATTAPPHDGINRGAFWQAAVSDGSIARNGVMLFTNSSSQVATFGHADLATTNGTIMFWMRAPGPNAGGGNEAAMLFDWRTSDGNAFVLSDDGTFFAQASFNRLQLRSTSFLTNNLWHHIAVTYDGDAAGGGTLYVDGVQEAANLNTGPWAWPVGAEIQLGLSRDGYWRVFNGWLDDVRMYDRILTAGEVSSAKNGAVVDAAALKLRYDFDGPPNGYAVTWPYGTLQSAPVVTGSYSTVSNVTSPFPVAPRGPQKYFRGQQ
jgi:hypothetical protein